MMVQNPDFKYYHLLNLINHFGPISRTELTMITDYRPGTVGDLIKQMLDDGIILEGGHTSVGHGRSRSLLQLNYNGLLAIGISVTAKKVVISLQQAAGLTLGCIEIRLTPDSPHNETIAKTSEACKKILASFPVGRCIGIGVACPSYNPQAHERDTLEESYHHYNNWITQDMAAVLEKDLALPVNTFSAVGLPAIAEYYFGQAKNAQNFICVELSNGIGSSIFCNGHIVAGAGNIAGQLGHMVIDYQAARNDICSCGKIGCVEASCAWPAIKASLINAVRGGANSSIASKYKSDGDFLAKDVAVCIESGDILCKRIVRQAAEKIGVAIANEINLLNPELVIMHGFMLELGPYFSSHLTEYIRENTLSLAKKYEIIYSEAFESIIPLGAAAEVFSSYFHSEEFDWINKIEKSSVDAL